MGDSSEIMSKIAKTYGGGVAVQASQQRDVERIPTGIFPLDLATGGGIPKGKIIEIFGPESSGKTNIALKLIAHHQKMHPHEKCVFINAEFAFDATWASRMGVDIDALILVEPQYAEQTVDIIEAFLSAEDVGLIVLDSVAAMVTAHEVENSAEKASVGGNSILVNRMVKKSLIAIAKASNSEKRYPTLVCINQVRTKIGVMYGDPETTPGGRALPFYAALRIRCYGKNLQDNAISSSVPAWKETKCALRKWKVPIIASNAEFKMAAIPNKKHNIGEVDDWNVVLSYAKQFGLIAKSDKGKWIFMGKEFPTLVSIQDLVESDFELRQTFRQELIDIAAQEIGVIAPQPEEKEKVAL